MLAGVGLKCNQFRICELHHREYCAYCEEENEPIGVENQGNVVISHVRQYETCNRHHIP